MFTSGVTMFTGKWNKPIVTYYIKNYDVNRSRTTMTDQTIRSEIQIAIKVKHSFESSLQRSVIQCKTTMTNQTIRVVSLIHQVPSIKYVTLEGEGVREGVTVCDRGRG